MKQVKELKIKNKKYLLNYDLVHVDNFDTDSLQVSKSHWSDFNVYGIEYVIKDVRYSDAYNFSFLLHLRNDLDRFFEESKGSKYLKITFSDSNKDFLIKYTKIWNEIKYKIKKASDVSSVKFDNDCMKIKFDTEDHLPLNKVLKIDSLTINIACIVEIDHKFYHKVYLNECYYVNDKE